MSVEWDKIKALNLCFKCCLASLYCQWTAYAWDRVESWDIGKLLLYCTCIIKTTEVCNRKNSHLIHMWHLPNIEPLLMVLIRKEKTKIFVHTALGPRLSMLWHPHFSCLLSASKAEIDHLKQARLPKPTA